MLFYGVTIVWKVSDGESPSERECVRESWRMSNGIGDQICTQTFVCVQIWSEELA